MDITQLFLDLAVIVGILLFAALAIVPIWLEHEADAADRRTFSGATPTQTAPGAPTLRVPPVSAGLSHAA